MVADMSFRQARADPEDRSRILGGEFVVFNLHKVGFR